MSLNDEPFSGTQKSNPSFFAGQHRQKLLVFVLWLIVIGAYWLLADYYDLSPRDKIVQLADWFTTSLFGPPLFIIFFALQPLVFFPSFLVGIAGGILYGPIWGTVYVILGANAAANVCYVVGRYFGQSILGGDQQATTLFHKYARGLRSKTFETILIMHLLIVVPFDIVNYLAGFLRMRWYQFALATLVGAIPGIFTFVLFGDSLGDISHLMAGQPEINLFTLSLSGTMLVVGLGLSRFIKGWEKRKKNQDV